MSSEREDRIETLEQLQNQGIDPFPHYFERTDLIRNVVDQYKGQDEDNLPKEIFRLAGRVMEIRSFGSLAFLDLRGETEDIQVILRDDEDLDLLEEYIHNGDIVGVEGKLTYTDKGEFSIQALDFQLLTKGIRPIPSDFYGIKDTETKYRDRPLHLTSDLEAREVFRKRSKIISQIRRFLEDKDFLEVETPTLQPVYGGAAAEPFTTEVEDLDQEWYLNISPELYLKRLIIGGFDRIFEITKNFRNESIDRTHNPEFTMMEIYQAYADYEDMMELTEQLYEHVAEEVFGSAELEYQGETLDFSAPWPRMTVKEAIEEYGGFDVDELSDEEIRQKMREHGAELESDYERGLAIAELFEEVAEENLIQPIHIIDHPQETTPLCKDHREKEDEGLIERFESFAAGMELSNAYTELRNPVQQREHFEDEQRRQEEGDDEAHPIDMDFVEALELGMPPTGGLGIGIDRMVMLMTDSDSIRDVLLFPMMK